MYLYSIVQSHMCAADDVGMLQGVAKSRQDHSGRLETNVSLLLNLCFVIGWYMNRLFVTRSGYAGIHRQLVRQRAIFNPAASGYLCPTATD
jgi:hypothetical protein